MRIPTLLAVSLALLAISFASSLAEAATLNEKFEKTYPLAAGAGFELRNTNGAVVLEAWDRNEVRVEAEKKVRADDAAAARKVMEQVKIEVSRSAGGLRIETRLPQRGDGLFDWLWGDDVNASVSYRIWIPRSAGLDVETVNGGVRLTGTQGRARLETTNGGITVERVQGNLELETTNGGIDVNDSAGAVRASTTNGGIEVELGEVPEGSDLSFSTTNGGVTVHLPRDIRVSLDAATSNGRVASDFEVEGSEARGKASRRRLAGDVNGGGGKLRIRTTNGSIRIVEG